MVAMNNIEQNALRITELIGLPTNVSTVKYLNEEIERFENEKREN